MCTDQKTISALMRAASWESGERKSLNNTVALSLQIPQHTATATVSYKTVCWVNPLLAPLRPQGRNLSPYPRDPKSHSKALLNHPGEGALMEKMIHCLCCLHAHDTNIKPLPRTLYQIVVVRITFLWTIHKNFLIFSGAWIHHITLVYADLTPPLLIIL